MGHAGKLHHHRRVGRLYPGRGAERHCISFGKAPIEAVFCNGATAYRIYTKYLLPVSGIPAVKLPSTSPANAACRPETLREVWGEALKDYITVSNL